MKKASRKVFSLMLCFSILLLGFTAVSAEGAVGRNGNGLSTGIVEAEISGGPYYFGNEVTVTGTVVEIDGPKDTLEVYVNGTQASLEGMNFTANIVLNDHNDFDIEIMAVTMFKNGNVAGQIHSTGTEVITVEVLPVVVGIQIKPGSLYFEPQFPPVLDPTPVHPGPPGYDPIPIPGDPTPTPMDISLQSVDPISYEGKALIDLVWSDNTTSPYISESHYHDLASWTPLEIQLGLLTKQVEIYVFHLRRVFTINVTFDESKVHTGIPM